MTKKYTHYQLLDISKKNWLERQWEAASLPTRTLAVNTLLSIAVGLKGMTIEEAADFMPIVYLGLVLANLGATAIVQHTDYTDLNKKLKRASFIEDYRNGFEPVTFN